MFLYAGGATSRLAILHSDNIQQSRERFRFAVTGCRIVDVCHAEAGSHGEPETTAGLPKQTGTRNTGLNVAIKHLTMKASF